MEFVNVAKSIPRSIRDVLVEKLTDLILNSKNADNMPSGLAKIILYYWQRDLLTSDVGIEKLLEAAILMEPTTTSNVISEELGLRETAIILKEIIR
jgi:hypothetical protein